MEQTGWKVPVQGERWINDMKKRLFVLMLAGLMTFGSSACVFAAETETEVTTEASSEAIPEITMDQTSMKEPGYPLQVDLICIFRLTGMYLRSPRRIRRRV